MRYGMGKIIVYQTKSSKRRFRFSFNRCFYMDVLPYPRVENNANSMKIEKEIVNMLAEVAE